MSETTASTNNFKKSGGWSQKTWGAVLTFAALTVLAGYRLNRWGEGGIERLALDQAVVDALTQFDFSGAQEYSIRKDKEGESTRWVLEGANRPVDANVADAFLRSMARIESARVVTDQASAFEEFRVDDAAGLTIKAFADGKPALTLVVGKNAPKGIYIRQADSVYLVEGVYPSSLEKDKADWLDRRLILEKDIDIHALSWKPIHSGEAVNSPPTLNLKKEGEGWRFESDATLQSVRQQLADFALSSKEVQQVATHLGSARFSSLMDQAAQKDFVATRVVTATDARGRTFGFEFADKKDDQYEVKVSDSGVIGVLTASSAERLWPSLADLEDKRLLSSLSPDDVAAMQWGPKTSNPEVLATRVEGEDGASSNTWTSATHLEASSGVLENRLRRWTNLEAEARAERSLGPIWKQAMLKGMDGTEYRILFGAEFDSEGRTMRTVQRAGDNVVYRLLASTADALLSAPEITPPTQPQALNQFPGAQGLPEEILRQLGQ